MRYKKQIEHLPTPENPRKNITVMVRVTELIKKVAIMLNSWSRIEAIKIGFLP